MPLNLTSLYYIKSNMLCMKYIVINTLWYKQIIFWNLKSKLYALVLILCLMNASLKNNRFYICQPLIKHH
jgi:hypothetical protein